MFALAGGRSRGTAPTRVSACFVCFVLCSVPCVRIQGRFTTKSKGNSHTEARRHRGKQGRHRRFPARFPDMLKHEQHARKRGEVTACCLSGMECGGKAQRDTALSGKARRMPGDGLFVPTGKRRRCRRTPKKRDGAARHQARMLHACYPAIRVPSVLLLVVNPHFLSARPTPEFGCG